MEEGCKSQHCSQRDLWDHIFQFLFKHTSFLKGINNFSPHPHVLKEIKPGYTILIMTQNPSLYSPSHASANVRDPKVTPVSWLAALLPKGGDMAMLSIFCRDKCCSFPPLGRVVQGLYGKALMSLGEGLLLISLGVLCGLVTFAGTKSDLWGLHRPSQNQNQKFTASGWILSLYKGGNLHTWTTGPLEK